MIKTRFAPSPTGYLHIGGVRTALYAWLFARRHGGKFVLRIEDTDRERSTQQAVDAILESMAWLGLDADEGPYYQTQRFDRYAEVASRMLADGLAYECYCSREELDAMRAAALERGAKPRYDGRCRERPNVREGVTPVIRFKNPPQGEVVVDDLVKGRIVFANEELDDFVLVRSDGTPTYNFAVVVDDVDMAITDVIRGDDHVNNTPRQINIMKALGAPVPRYAHLSMINGPDGTKLSKRHGAVNVLEYRDMGYLPEALLNYLARLGWSHGDQEIFTVEEMTRLFDLGNVSVSAANFDPVKLKWVNQQHLAKLPTERLARELSAQLERLAIDTRVGPPLPKLVEALRERSETTLAMAEQAARYFLDHVPIDAAAAKTHLTAAARTALIALHEAFEGLAEWDEAATLAAVQGVAAALGLKLGKVAQPLRVALVGTAASPDIGTTLALVGRERTLARIHAAIAHIDAETPAA